ncbi:hypothetical protein C8F01DRAFT_1311299 [Mycena amicta]|nr:hypothetical protein C8F01DRAFT_1311299 [Mycena amicta]
MSTEVEVQLNNNHFSLDWSYTNMGFIVHRSNSISMCSMSVDPQYEDPQFTSKRTREKNQSTTGGASLALSPKPVGTFNIQHTQGIKDVEEHTDQMGPFGNPNNAIFGFDLELDLKRSSALYKSGLPNDIGCVIRNQVMIWATYVPNVFTDNALETYESVRLDLHGDSDMISRLPPETEPNTIAADNYVAIARLPMAGTMVKKSIFAKLKETLKLDKSAKEKTHKLPLYEVILPREAISQQWMGPLWPSMNSQLQKMDSSSKKGSHIWVAWQQQPVKVHHIQQDPPAALSMFRPSVRVMGDGGP